MVTLTPDSMEEAGTALHEAWLAGRTIAFEGGGTQSGHGHATCPPDVLLRTGALNRLVAYEPGDLTVTVEAGMPWAGLLDTLAAHGQWPALDPAALPGATVGGIVATNASGPLRLHYGTARDLVIGARFLLADGSPGRSGGRVVKNVTGYDLHKLLIGSFGTLALITELSLKVLPLPETRRWLAASFPTADAALAAARALAGTNLSPAALELVNAPARAWLPVDHPAAESLLLVAADGLAVSVARQIEGMAAGCRDGGGDVALLSLAEGAAVYTALRDLRINAPSDLCLCWGVLPTDLPAAWRAAGSLAAQIAPGAVLQARAGTGLVFLYGTLSAEPDAAFAAIREARADVEVRGGSLVAEMLPAALRGRLDTWGIPGGESLPAMQAVKRALDDRNLLSAGRFVI